METANRHPADRLHDVRTEIRALEVEEAALRAHLLAHPEDRVGVEHEAVVGSQSRRRIDLRALANEIGASVLRRFTRVVPTDVVRLRERSEG